MTNNQERCSTCRFWLRFQDGQPMGICRKNPPTVVCSGSMEEVQQPAILGAAQPKPSITPLIHTYFPAISEGGWCGCHQFDKGRLSC